MASVKERVIEISSNQWYAPLLINNPNHREFFVKTFGKDVFGPVFRAFFKPQASVQERIDR